MAGVGCVETQLAVTMLADTRTRIVQAEAEQVRWLASLAADPDPYRDGTGEQGKDWIVEDVACALKIPSATAAAKLHVAAQLTRRFPATLAAMTAGHLELRSATKLVELAEALPDAVLPKLEAEALENVDSRTHAQFCARLRKLVVQADPRDSDEQHQTQREQRRVVFTPLDHGMVELWAQLPADRAAPLQAELNRRADLDKADGRTADQRRADALCDLFDGTSGGPQIQVTVPISTLLGDSDQPGDLAGHGPISPGLTRALAHDPTGTWRRLVTDSFGRLVDVTSRRYTPPAPMQRLVELRDGSCRFPTCRRRATSCELDHVVPWSKGGQTTPANLIPLRSRHHHAKHDGHWRTERLPGRHRPLDQPHRSRLRPTPTRPAAELILRGTPRSGAGRRLQRVITNLRNVCRPGR